jgi:hypothetical protein
MEMAIHNPDRDDLLTWSVNTAANLMSHGFEPIAVRENVRGRTVIAFPAAARAALHRLHTHKARAAEMLGGEAR